MSGDRRDDTLDALNSALRGQYVLERILGEGAMGRVYLAHDLRLDRPVAIKVIGPDLAVASTFRDRFLLEARLVAKLRHPGIVAVFAAGEAGEHLYFVMEYIRGESVRELLQRSTRPDFARTTSILVDVAAALAYAHAQGVVHRDVKPENVLLDERSGRAMLTDFGIARSVTASDDGRLTGIGLIVGSPEYMSPEQAAGDREVGGRSDIYSLGLVGYELVVGEPVFLGPSAAAVIAKHVSEPAPKIAQRAPGTPSSLAIAIDRALNKDPDERWSSAAAMEAALRSGAVPPTGEAEPAAGPSRHGRALFLGGSALALAALGWLAASSRGPAVDDTARPSYLVMPFGMLRGDASLDWLRQGSVDMLTRNIGQWSDVAVIDYERTLDLLKQARLDTSSDIRLSDARILARKAGARSVMLGQIQRHGDSLTVIGRVFDVRDGKLRQEIPVSALVRSDARSLFDALANQLLGLAGATPGQQKVQVAQVTTASLEAYRHYLRGVRALHAWDLEVADSALGLATAIDTTFALAYFRRALAQGWRRVADTLARKYARLAAAHAARLPARERALVEGQLEQEEGHYERSQQRYAALLARDSTDAEAWYGLGESYYHAQPKGSEDIATRLTLSLRAFNRTIELDSSFHLAYSHRIDMYARLSVPSFPWIVERDSILYLPPEEGARRFGAARIDRARATARDLAIQTGRAWVDADPAAAPAYQTLADAYASAKRYDDAIAVLQRAMRAPRTHYADFSYRVASFQLPSDPERALATLREAMRSYDLDSLSRRGSASRAGTLLAAANVAMYAGALDDLDRLLDLQAAVEPTVAGTARSGSPLATRTATWPLRLGIRGIFGMERSLVRFAVDSAIRRIDAMPDAPRAILRRQSTGLLYNAYVSTRDTQYLALLTAWTGREPPLVLRAMAAMTAGDTALAQSLAARFAEENTAPPIPASNQIDDPLSKASVLAALGEPRRALAVLEAINPAHFSVTQVDLRWAMYPASFLERGALYERIGDRERAIAAYERFLDLIRGSAPALRAPVALATNRLAVLRDSRAATSLPR